ncbi:MAG TPA: nuclear transport factor 2 family protein [Acidimicrobiia bacterium]|nr:nuclear transport factor 2 family protein [Acidimicrobiia bacterium]
MESAAVERWSDAYRRAWEEADSEAAAALFAEDGTYRNDIYQDRPNQGRAGVAEYWTTVTASQSEATVRIGAPLVDGERAVVEFWTTMKVDDDPVTLAGALLLDFDDEGLCTALREYYNFSPGFHEPPEGWGS